MKHHRLAALALAAPLAATLSSEAEAAAIKSEATANASTSTTRKLRASNRRGLAATTTTATYPSASPLSSPLPNPERGFYWQHSYRSSQSSSGGSQRLSVDYLKNKRENTGMTLLLRLYYLDTFLSSDLSQEVLDDIAADFVTMREAGMKCVLRFAYIDHMNSPYVSEPSKSQLLTHISQLAPVLAGGEDVISLVQAGFVGPWGEWHSSTHFADDLDGRKEVTRAVLDAVPGGKVVQIRTPKHKKELFTEYEYPDPTDGYLTDGGFENGASEWGGYDGGFVLDTTQSKSGTSSVKVTSGGARQYVSLNPPVEAGNIVRLSGYSKGVNTPSNIGGDYSIYADVTLEDGAGQASYLWGQTANFLVGGTSSDWEYAERDFVVPDGKRAVGMTLYCMYRNQNQGYAYFDDINVQVFGSPVQISGGVLTSSSAHADTYLARAGHHNDCFLASDTDYGTYVDASHSEYPYLSEETKYTAMGGETCAPNPPRSSCDTAREEMELFHYTYLNIDYHTSVIDSWVSGGCMDEIRSRMGYRLVLKDGTYPTTSAPGGAMDFEVNLDNEGWAAPVNPRRVQLVLKHVDTGGLCAATFNSPADVDARTWYGGESHILSGTVTLPSSVPEGQYDMYLHITDPDSNLRTRLEYKISVANGGGLNDPSTGLIDLGHTVDVASENPSSSGGSGSQLALVCDAESDVLPGYGAPTTKAPTTSAPVTSAPVTSAPVTSAPVTSAPVTSAPVTSAPTTKAPTTSAPVTSAPVTPAPVTSAPVTQPPVPSPTSPPVPSGPTSLVDNGSFEGPSVSTAWSSYGSGYSVVSDEVQSGSQAVRVTNGAAKQKVTLNAAAGSTIKVSGYSKSTGASTGLWNDYSVYTDVVYANGGGYLWGQCARFAGGSATEDTWTYSEWTFVAEKEVAYLTLYTMYRNDGGTAWFDDVSVTVTPP